MESISSTQTCWCSDRELVEFSPDYSRCLQCGTLILTKGLTLDDVRVTDDESGLYSKEYWLSHQTQDFGYPDIYLRSRQDLPERNLYCLNTLMKYRLPSAKILELGCAHGGSVAMMRWAGFDAIGVEISPWVVEFAKRSFDLPILLGPIEDLSLEPANFDVIVLYDVLEHLPNPYDTMQLAASLLKEDGIFIVQTPNHQENKTYEEMVLQHDNFLSLMIPEHTYLFSHRSILEFFKRLGFEFLVFEQQLFDYDMYFVASRQAIVRNTDEQIAHNLSKRSSGRMVLALLDSAAALTQLQAHSQQERQQSQSQLLASQQQFEQSQHQLAQLQSQIDIEKMQLCESQAQQLAQLQNQIHEAEQQKVAQQQRDESQQQQIAQLQQQIDRSTQQENERLAAAQRQVQQVHLQQLHHQIQGTEALVATTNAEIASMKTTKFWKLRTYWFKFKHIIGWQSTT